MDLSSHTPTAADTAEAAAPGGLFQHRNRPEWGLATFAWRRDGRAAYQFEDGQLRRIAASHEELMVAVERPGDEGERRERDLIERAGLTAARQKRRSDGEGPLITLDEQVRLLIDDFEGGFADPSWLQRMRGRSGASRAKRHRNAAIEEAARLLDRSQLGELLALSSHHLVIERVTKLLHGTSLVSKRQLAPLEGLSEPQRRRAASALYMLLDDEADTRTALQEWIDALTSAGSVVSWSLATAPLALARPDEHVCVRANVFVEQAKWMAPRMAIAKRPSGRQYVALQKMALKTAEGLRQRDLEPKDLLDVHDFIFHTLRPASRKRIAHMPPLPRESQVTTKRPSDAEAADAA